MTEPKWRPSDKLIERCLDAHDANAAGGASWNGMEAAILASGLPALAEAALAIVERLRKATEGEGYQSRLLAGERIGIPYSELCALAAAYAKAMKET